ncbi:Fic family protein [Collinsella intestinalis]|uniref:Fic family protein n=1 Tax=Collinsella intestinalis TaxID=147207 RepID=UPI0022E52365|nr:Fic family protein [Collinsella intestinalis]
MSHSVCRALLGSLQLLENLTDFCNNRTLPAVAKSAIAHAQLESIRPLNDGNGHTSGALTFIRGTGRRYRSIKLVIKPTCNHAKIL